PAALGRVAERGGQVLAARRLAGAGIDRPEDDDGARRRRPEQQGREDGEETPARTVARKPVSQERSGRVEAHCPFPRGSLPARLMGRPTIASPPAALNPREVIPSRSGLV